MKWWSNSSLNSSYRTAFKDLRNRLYCLFQQGWLISASLLLWLKSSSNQIGWTKVLKQQADINLSINPSFRKWKSAVSICRIFYYLHLKLSAQACLFLISIIVASCSWDRKDSWYQSFAGLQAFLWWNCCSLYILYDAWFL